MVAIAWAGLILGACAQTSMANLEPVYDVATVEVAPEYPGGREAMYAFISANQHYQDSTAFHEVQGKVYVRFVVEKDGSISEKSVVKDVDPFLDEEAIRLVNIMPRWTPGLIAGQPVRTRLILPFSFRLF